jgi:hypothetical protein
MGRFSGSGSGQWPPRLIGGAADAAGDNLTGWASWVRGVFGSPESSVAVVFREPTEEVTMHAKEFLDDFYGSSLIHVAGFKFVCRGLRRDCGVGQLLGDVGSLRLFDFVRLLVHSDTVCGWGEGVNGTDGGNRGNGP